MADRITKRREAAKARAKFDRLNAMFEAGAPAKARRSMSDSWQRRTSSNVAGFHKPKKVAA